MKRFLLCTILCLLLIFSCAAAESETARIINCSEWVSLRDVPDSNATNTRYSAAITGMAILAIFWEVMYQSEGERS